MSVSWKIRIFDSLEVIWETTVPVHRITASAMKEKVLPCLIAPYLTSQEILLSTINNRNGKLSRANLLDVHVDNKTPKIVFSTAGNPYAVASYVRH